MNDAKNLMIILDILNEQWGDFNKELTQEQLTLLKTELDKLTDILQSTDNSDKINDISKDFLQLFQRIEPLACLSDINDIETRTGTIPDIDKEIRIKIINYCVTLKDKISLTGPDKDKIEE